MDRDAALQKLLDLLALGDDITTNTSMRVPVNLRDAAAVAVAELGAAQSITSLTVAGMRRSLEQIAFETGLELMYDNDPTLRPSLGEVAVALAEQLGSPFTSQPEMLERSAQELMARHPDADAYDVLLWAEARQITAA